MNGTELLYSRLLSIAIRLSCASDFKYLEFTSRDTTFRPMTCGSVWYQGIYHLYDMY